MDMRICKNKVLILIKENEKRIRGKRACRNGVVLNVIPRESLLVGLTMYNQ